MIAHDLNPDLIFYCTNNKLCVSTTVDNQCLECLGYITLDYKLLVSGYPNHVHIIELYFHFVPFIGKGQLISKAIYGLLDSPQKTNEG